jgi:hypothetical protein
LPLDLADTGVVMAAITMAITTGIIMGTMAQVVVFTMDITAIMSDMEEVLIFRIMQEEMVRTENLIQQLADLF